MTAGVGAFVPRCDLCAASDGARGRRSDDESHLRRHWDEKIFLEIETCESVSRPRVKTVLMSSRSEKFGPPRSVTVEGAPPRRKSPGDLTLFRLTSNERNADEMHTHLHDALLTTIVV
jgi:hypothetical protein